jgi:N-ethylmaleimide reductase
VAFPIAVAKAVVDAIGGEKVGIRLSPANPLHDIVEDHLEETYGTLIAGLAELGLAYVHILESPGQRQLTQTLRGQWPGALILNPATDPSPTGLNELALVEEGTTELLAYGALFLANPDLPARLKAGGPFNTPERTGFFGGDHRGYTDYPALN